MARSSAGLALLVVGSLLIAAAVALLGRAYLGQWIHDLQRPAVAEELLPARLDTPRAQPTTPSAGVGSPTPTQEATVPTKEPEASAAPSAAEVAPAAPVAPPTHTPGPPPKATPTPLPEFGRPVRMVIPSTDVESPVMGVGISNGVYEVPGWDVGWHEDSALLGIPGNTIFNGHLETIDAGRVFGRLHQLEPGDMVYIYSTGYRTAWVVETSERVPNSEHSFVGPTDDTRVTLYTCEGQFNWETRRYSHYRVVVARFVEATKRTPAE